MSVSVTDFDSGLSSARAIMRVANLAHPHRHLAQPHRQVVEEERLLGFPLHGKVVNTVYGAVDSHPDLDTERMEHVFSRGKFARVRTLRTASIHKERLADHDPSIEVACPQCGQRFLPNGWTGFTPVNGESYGQRTWICPTCGVDLDHVVNRPRKVLAKKWVEPSGDLSQTISESSTFKQGAEDLNGNPIDEPVGGWETWGGEPTWDHTERCPGCGSPNTGSRMVPRSKPPEEQWLQGNCQDCLAGWTIDPDKPRAGGDTDPVWNEFWREGRRVAVVRTYVPLTVEKPYGHGRLLVSSVGCWDTS